MFCLSCFVLFLFSFVYLLSENEEGGGGDQLSVLLLMKNARINEGVSLRTTPECHCRDSAASSAHQKYCVGSDLSHICTWTCEVIPG